MLITADTNIGHRAGENQDFYLAGRLSDGSCWAVLCDGMGGCADGDVASTTVCGIFSEMLSKGLPDALSDEKIRILLLDSAEKANSELFRLSAKYPVGTVIGTTLVALVARGNTGYIVHSGDSRGYLIHKKNVKQLTHDHSVVQELVDSGIITAEEAKNHPKRNVITAAVGIDNRLKISYNRFRISRDDVILLCSDGLYNVLNDDDILIHCTADNFFTSASSIVQTAYDFGSGDNITAVLIKA